MEIEKYPRTRYSRCWPFCIMYIYTSDEPAHVHLFFFFLSLVPAIETYRHAANSIPPKQKEKNHVVAVASLRSRGRIDVQVGKNSNHVRGETKKENLSPYPNRTKKKNEKKEKRNKTNPSRPSQQPPPPPPRPRSRQLNIRPRRPSPLPLLQIHLRRENHPRRRRDRKSLSTAPRRNSRAEFRGRSFI